MAWTKRKAGVGVCVTDVISQSYSKCFMLAEGYVSVFIQRKKFKGYSWIRQKNKNIVNVKVSSQAAWNCSHPSLYTSWWSTPEHMVQYSGLGIYYWGQLLYWCVHERERESGTYEKLIIRAVTIILIIS